MKRDIPISTLTFTPLDVLLDLWVHFHRRDDAARGFSGRDSILRSDALRELEQLTDAIDHEVAEAVEGMRERKSGKVGTWSSPAIFWAMVKVGVFDMENMSYSQIKDRWEIEYKNQLALGQWEDVPKPLVALPAPGKSRSDNESAKKQLLEIGASNLVKTDGRDHCAWAKNILDRKKLGDKTLSMIQLKFATEALNAKAA